MKKLIIILLLIIISFYIQSCKDEKINPEPLTLKYIIENVSKYGENDGCIDLTVTGGTPPYIYTWSNNQFTEDIDSLTAGIYSVIVTDINSYMASDTFTIIQPAPDLLIISLTGKEVSINGGNDGAAYSNVTGGVKPYQYNWSNGSIEKDITGLVSGIYKLTVTDALGTTTSDNIYISQPDINKIVISYLITEPLETGASDGAIDISISGGVTPYSYLWSNGSVQEDQTNLVAGDYSVTVTDLKGQIETKTINVSDVVTDIDNNIYTKVKIGNQIWIKENLKVTRTPDGTTIASYAYNNIENNAVIYGRLYTWNVAMNNSVIEGSQGLCPCGWHIPSDAEFKTLEISLGMTPADADLENTWRGDGIGTSLKAGGASGYNAQLSGRFTSPGQYSLLGTMEYMWTSTEYGAYAWRRCLDKNATTIGRWNTFPKSYGFSVRCVKD